MGSAALVVAAAGLWPACALAETAVEAPVLKVGDHWVYKETTERGAAYREELVDVVVDRIAGKYVEISTKQPDSPAPALDRLVPADWSRERSVNGKLTIVNRPLNFPLQEGKRWTVEYTELNPARLVKSEHLHVDYTVGGWEDIQTPAGVFRALKIEAEGDWTKETAPAVVSGGVAEADASGAGSSAQSRRLPSQTGSGRIYKVFWYVPEIKRFAKVTEEIFNSSGVRSERTTGTLQSFKPAT
ncbi:hypothetical protein [Caulobacter sp. S45]|uniref:hypothetical protein n=1 Tax=Caulobacter sp. S45 TaxID=1641861 RepID=UPI00131AB460|nr:hypothetical protein [Caulobacter sp. S45]